MEESRRDIFSEEPWFVYIILCRGGSLYTGICKDPDKRFKAHLSGRGAKYTQIYKPIKFVHIEKHTNHRQAFQRELEIKSLPVSKKRVLANLL